MSRALSLGVTLSVGLLGAASLGARALPFETALMTPLAPYDAGLQMASAREILTTAAPGSAGADAVVAARRSIHAMPYNQPAAALLYHATDRARTGRLLDATAALGWRDPLANSALVRVALANAAPTIAAQRIDALGRTQGAQFAAPFADRLLAGDGGPQALAVRAGHRDTAQWWPGYLRSAPSSPDARAGRIAFAKAIDPAQGPGRRALIAGVIQQLESSGQYRAALSAWRETLAEGEASAGVIHDPDLQGLRPEGSAVGGEWRYSSASGYALERSDRGLELSRAGAGKSPVLAQMLMASPGAYRLQVRGTQSGTSLRWQLHCGGLGMIFESDDASGAWLLTIPRSCSQVVLQLQPTDRDPGSARATIVSVMMAGLP